MRTSIVYLEFTLPSSPQNVFEEFCGLTAHTCIYLLALNLVNTFLHIQQSIMMIVEDYF